MHNEKERYSWDHAMEEKPKWTKETKQHMSIPPCWEWDVPPFVAFKGYCNPHMCSTSSDIHVVLSLDGSPLLACDKELANTTLICTNIHIVTHHTNLREREENWGASW